MVPMRSYMSSVLRDPADDDVRAEDDAEAAAMAAGECPDNGPQAAGSAFERCRPVLHQWGPEPAPGQGSGMCILLILRRPVPGVRLLMIHNRDEVIVSKPV